MTRRTALLLLAAVIVAALAGVGIGYVAFSNDSPLTRSQAPGAQTSSDSKERPSSAETTGSASGAAGSKDGESSPAGGRSPGRLAAEGSDLATLTSMPVQGAVRYVRLPEPFTGARYDLEFAPYGWIPNRDTGRGGLLLVRVSKMASASGQAGEFRDMTGEDAVLRVLPKATAMITEGGTWAGMMEIRPLEGRGELVLVDAKRAD